VSEPVRLAPLAVYQHFVGVGSPLAFGIRDAEGRLLLARGQVVGTAEQLELLLQRGAKVDLAELQSTRRDPRKLRPDELPACWRESITVAARLLRVSLGNGFVRALDEVAAPLLQLIARDPDLAIFQVVRQEGMADFQYGAQHGVHAGIAAVLAARELGASADESLRAFRAALTMNLSVVELQGKLAHQLFAVKPQQRTLLREHPMRSRQMLEERGVQDAEWLRAVAEHHELPGGGGYPSGLHTPSTLARLITVADVYTAKLSTRASRAPLPSDRAARDLFVAHRQEPAASALVKAFGLYPPGTLVRLASGEAAIVLRRGATPQTPLAAALVNRSGEPMMNPARRDCAHAAHAIQAVQEPRQLRVEWVAEKLMAL